MTSFPRSPRLQKGAIVALDSRTNRITQTVRFQYNPQTLTRTLQAQGIGGEMANRDEAFRLRGAPIETIKLEIELDATDQLAKGDPIAVAQGVHPQLATLEALIYPKSASVIARNERAKAGMLEVIPEQAPITILEWGYRRILPVRLTDFDITEDEFDVKLNPIRASVSLSLRVLNYDDLPWGSRAAMLFLVHHIQKEIMVAKGWASGF
jgi:hypothetical protein